MPEQNLKEALSNVAEALEKVNKAFENHLQNLQEAGSDPAKIQQATEAVRSMRDSAAMYLAWAHHYTGIPQTG